MLRLRRAADRMSGHMGSSLPGVSCESEQEGGGGDRQGLAGASPAEIQREECCCGKAGCEDPAHQTFLRRSRRTASQVPPVMASSGTIHSGKVSPVTSGLKLTQPP